MVTQKIVKPSGILNPKAAESIFHLTRHLPPSDLNFFIERYWIVTWDLRGQEPYLQENIPNPCVNLVVEQNSSGIYGAGHRRSSRLLKEQGRAFGVKFRPGAFYPFIRSPLSRLTGLSICIDDVFGAEGVAFESRLLSLEDEYEMVAVANDFFRAHLPEHDQNIEVVNQIVDRIITDRTITKVDDIVRVFNLNKRTLQRLFNQYVGVSPKWVIQIYRLHEAACQLAGKDVVDWSSLALDLGYFDQAHFIKDFKALIGRSPTDYVRLLGSPAT
jgi:AraC-like DNA-binding protein